MRLLLVNKFHGRRGGAESVVLQTQRLVEQAGHEVIPFAMQQEGDAPSPWREYFVPTRDYFSGSLPRRVSDSLSSIYSFDARRRIGAVIQLTRPDVAHLHNVYHQLTLSIVDELRDKRIPIVMTLHDYKPACPNYQLLTSDGPCTRCVGGAYWNAVQHRCIKGSLPGSVVAAAEAYLNRLRGQYRKVDLFLSPSGFLRDIMVRAGLPPDRIAVLPNAVPTTATERASPEHPTFLYFGRLSSEKGLDDLLTASARLPDGVKVVLLGSGPLEAHLRERAEREGLPIVFRRFGSPEVVARELSAVTAAVLPSRWYENCPMSVLEASAAGVATIASEIGGIPELITSGVDGILVGPGDTDGLAAAMRELADDAAWATRLGEAARARVAAHHGEGGYGEALLDHYETLIAASRTPGGS